MVEQADTRLLLSMLEPVGSLSLTPFGETWSFRRRVVLRGHDVVLLLENSRRWVASKQDRVEDEASARKEDWKPPMSPKNDIKE